MELSQVSLLESYFDFFYAKEISKNMYLVFRKKCFGCQNACLSQSDHTCLTLTDKQQLELYFDDILAEVDESDIVLKWNEATSLLDVSVQVLNMFQIKSVL
ncbi:hypothetical protein MAR_011755 [Mya arenaria]|uniref:Uncharacterized protein n=1 Tax=Mya arenaria TaxID=6604 RepID=A0ABY7G430_MYAAR|nr:hypothetical protein MAR_011755 [Mya arenaria]